MKPILVFYLKNPTAEKLAQSHFNLPQELKDEYHCLLVGTGLETHVQVFFEKDQVELDNEKLQKLLSYCDYGNKVNS